MPKNRDNILRGLFENTSEPIVIADTDRRIVDLNPAFTTAFGYTLDELEGQETRVLYADGDSFNMTGRKLSDDGAASMNASGNSQTLYFRYRRKDGSIFPARTLATRLVGPDGVVTGFVGTITDLSEMERRVRQQNAPIAMTELGASERALVHALFEKLPAIMHAVNERMTITQVSQMWLDRFGYTRDAVLGRSVWDFMPEEDAQRSRETVSLNWRDGGRFRVPYNFLTKTGDIVEVELSSVADTSDDEFKMVIILEDVTERNRAFADLTDKNEQLRDFARMAAHDLQAPLRHISLFAEMIIEEAETGDSVAATEHARDLQSSATRLSGLVKGLLDFSLANEAKVKAVPCDLARIVSNAVQSLRPRIEETEARITVGALPTAFCDPALMERVIENVLGNALKYVHRGVTPEVSVAARDTGTALEIAVDDNGIGIEPLFRERIFEPMRRLHGPESDYQGSGIGLALCKRIVSAHGGNIWVEDSEQGSSFRIRLPGQRTLGGGPDAAATGGKGLEGEDNDHGAQGRARSGD